MKNIYVSVVTIITTCVAFSQNAYMNISHQGIQPEQSIVVELGQEITFEYGGGGNHPMTSGTFNGDFPIYFPIVTVTSGNPIEVFSLTEVKTYTFHCGTNPGNTTNWGTIIVEASEPHFTPGDVNDDGIINILDIVGLVNFIMGNASLPAEEAGDLNADGVINILDIVQIVNIILGGSVDFVDASASIDKNTLNSLGSIGGLQFLGTLISPILGNDIMVAENGV
jgi:hypothetical protein